MTRSLETIQLAPLGCSPFEPVTILRMIRVPDKKWMTAPTEIPATNQHQLSDTWMSLQTIARPDFGNPELMGNNWDELSSPAYSRLQIHGGEMLLLLSATRCWHGFSCSRQSDRGQCAKQWQVSLILSFSCTNSSVYSSCSQLLWYLHPSFIIVITSQAKSRVLVALTDTSLCHGSPTIWDLLYCYCLFLNFCFPISLQRSHLFTTWFSEAFSKHLSIIIQSNLPVSSPSRYFLQGS